MIIVAQKAKVRYNKEKGSDPLEIGEVFKVSKDDFAVIGKLGQGTVETAADWVGPLWPAFEQDLSEVAELTSAVDLWGLMSDAKSWLDPWQEEGKYLAGIECPLEVTAPEGWTKWVIPAMDYLVFKTDGANMDFMITKMFEEILPQQGLQVIAAIQEHYQEDFEADQVELYFPVKLL